MLFPGAHADVGGGYTTSNGESGLSDGARRWLTDELRALGVQFAASPLIVEQPNPAGPAHRPWLTPLWLALPRGRRTLPAGLGLSQSVIDRINAGPVAPDPGAPAIPYSPANVGPYLNGLGLGPASGVNPV